MVQEYKPTTNFLSDFYNSLETNVSKFDSTYDSLGGGATLVQSFADQLSA